MFKRVTKKQKKREELEELGLSDVPNDDDSDSSSEASSDSEDDNEAEDGQQESATAKDSDEDIVEGEEEEESGSEEEEDGEFEGDPPMTIEEAKTNPIYLVSKETGIHGCIVCPTKKLKKEDIVSTHVLSSGHKRRFERFLETIKETTFGTDDPRIIVAAITTLTKNPPTLTSITGVLSNRGKKRKEKMDRIRKMRLAQKEMKAKAIRKRDAKRSAASKSENSAEDGAEKGDVKKTMTTTVTGKHSKGKGKDKDVEGPVKKKRKVSKDAFQTPVEAASKYQSSEAHVTKSKGSTKPDNRPTTPREPKQAPKVKAAAKEADATAPSETDKPKAKKRKRPNKSRASE